MQRAKHFEFVSSEKEIEEKLREEGRTWMFGDEQNSVVMATDGVNKTTKSTKWPVIVTNNMKKIVP